MDNLIENSGSGQQCYDFPGPQCNSGGTELSYLMSSLNLRCRYDAWLKSRAADAVCKPVL